MKVIITGAQFGNKGAQSLLFNVVDQLRKHYGDVDIYFLTLDGNRLPHEKNYHFHTVYGIYFYQKYFHSLADRICLIAMENLKRVVKKKYYTLNGTKQIRNIFINADLLIDVSGYALSSKWSIESNKQFLTSFTEAEKYGVKTVIMPQSFGPFDYGENSAEMDKRIKKLKSVNVIYAREKEGYDLLTTKYGLTNVRLSPDLVLQNKELDLANIFMKIPKQQRVTLQTANNNICVIPNTQTANHSDTETVVKLYRSIVKKLLKLGKNIYIFNHANDMPLCRKIYQTFQNNENVRLIKNDLSSIEYEYFIKQFDYIICSRYHGIVHAYREHVPAVILGWAIKYKELAKHFGQSEYIFDITDSAQETDEIMLAIEKMNGNYKNESDKIGDILDEIQSASCFEECFSIVDGIKKD